MCVIISRKVFRIEFALHALINSAFLLRFPPVKLTLYFWSCVTFVDLLTMYEDVPELEDVQLHDTFSAPCQKMALLNAIGRNPKEYLNRGGNSEDMEVIRDLAVILGEHFTKLADKAENEQKRNTKIKKPLIEEIETPAERELKRKVEEALANEKVKEALQDESVKQIIHCLSSDSDRGQRLAAEASGDVKEKLKLLIQFGVLGVQTS
ncbi:hypothetical protein SprV_0301128700 [Sparganum proliferum]